MSTNMKTPNVKPANDITAGKKKRTKKETPAKELKTKLLFGEATTIGSLRATLKDYPKDAKVKINGSTDGFLQFDPSYRDANFCTPMEDEKAPEPEKETNYEEVTEPYKLTHELIHFCKAAYEMKDIKLDRVLFEACDDMECNVAWLKNIIADVANSTTDCEMDPSTYTSVLMMLGAALLKHYYLTTSAAQEAQANKETEKKVRNTILAKMFDKNITKELTYEQRKLLGKFEDAHVVVDINLTTAKEIDEDGSREPVSISPEEYKKVFAMLVPDEAHKAKMNVYNPYAFRVRFGLYNETFFDFLRISTMIDENYADNNKKRFELDEVKQAMTPGAQCIPSDDDDEESD